MTRSRTYEVAMVALLAMAGVLTCLGVASGQNPSGPSIGRMLQATARAMEVDPAMQGRDTDLSRMFAAYRKGIPFYVKVDGKPSMYALEFGLAEEDWPVKKSEPALEDAPLADSPPGVFVFPDEQLKMNVVSLAPIKVAEDLWVYIQLSVISKEVKKPGVVGADFLVPLVKISGGSFGRLKPCPHLERQTLVDLWSASSEQRITIDTWEPTGTGDGHSSTAIYGPLFFRVLESPPEYLLIGERKITLSKRFQDGCKELCQKIVELRIADGQPKTPQVRGTGQ